VILKTQSRKKPNNPFKRLLKQFIICVLFKMCDEQRNILMRSADTLLAQLFYWQGNLMLD